jgi:hypothetical protein
VSLPRPSARVVLSLIVAMAVASSVAIVNGAPAWASQPRASVASKPATNYRIFKIYMRYLEASPDRARAAQNDRINDLVLRYGNKNWGLDHLKAKHGWGSALDSAIQHLVSDPKTQVRAEGGGTYRWDDFQEFKGELCPFRVVENRNRLSDGYEKGIITAYPLPPCGETFI